MRRAWPNGDKGMATLQFDLGDRRRRRDVPQGTAGILQNLSFGTLDLQAREDDGTGRDRKASRRT